MQTVNDAIEAIKNGEKKPLEKLIKKKPEFLQHKDKYERTLLHVASETNHVEIIKILVEKGASVSAHDKAGWTPLHSSSQGGHYAALSVLLRKGANANALNSEGTAALSYLVRNEWSPDMIRAMMDMLEAGADVNGSNKFQETALHQAASRGRFESVEFLLARGAKINYANNFGETALHKAVRSNAVRVVALLLQHGADALQQGDQGLPRDIAASFSHTEIVELLDKHTGQTDLTSALRNSGTGVPRSPQVSVSRDGVLSYDVQGSVHMMQSITNTMKEKSLTFSINTTTLEDASPEGAAITSRSEGDSETSSAGLSRTASQSDLHDDLSSLPSANLPPAPARSRFSLTKRVSIGNGLQVSQSMPAIPATIAESNNEMAGATTHSIFSGTTGISGIVNTIKGTIGRKQVHINGIKVGGSFASTLTPRQSSSSLSPTQQTAPAQLWSSMHTPLAVGHSDFELDLGKVDPLVLEYPLPAYLRHMYSNDHTLCVGYVRPGRDNQVLDPILVSIMRVPTDGVYRAILWTKYGDFSFYIAAPNMQVAPKRLLSSFSKPLQANISRLLLQNVPNIVPDKAKVWLDEIKLDTDFEEIKQSLKDFEQSNPQRPNRYSIGVLYSKDGQTTEEEIIANKAGSEAYEEFLAFLGDRIELQGWSGYRADLDTKTNTTGTHSLYTSWKPVTSYATIAADDVVSSASMRDPPSIAVTPPHTSNPSPPSSPTLLATREDASAVPAMPAIQLTGTQSLVSPRSPTSRTPSPILGSSATASLPPTTTTTTTNTSPNTLQTSASANSANTIVPLTLSQIQQQYQQQPPTNTKSQEWVLPSFEIMFHVGTMLPFEVGAEEQISRKRRIGNNMSCIIFQDGGSYVPPIRSKFLHIYYIITPLQIDGHTHYRLAVCSKKGVPSFGPDLHHPAIYEKNQYFREFLLSKLVNGQLAALRSPELAEKVFVKPKEAFLDELVKRGGIKLDKPGMSFYLDV
eukprot:TRINITY_DN4704_c0_g1_i3.p1 TRINITY_DN4704_c0_g1~~TRINITY_DN4704_c0_g1_i3.p1  ORF type:complete len:975 (-),score=243.49 TRINITY_DN4704_c0_g1_i3:78-3002(-)